MGLNVGGSAAGRFDDFQKFSTSRFAVKHFFVVESKIDGEELPSLFVLRGVFPFNEVQTFPLERDNSNIYYPEIIDVSDVEVEFYETMDNVVFNFFENWYDKIFASNEKDDVVFNLPDNFKKSIYVFRLDTRGKEGTNDFTRVFGYEYSGCFPKRISDYPLDMSTADAVSLGITFSVDGVRRLKKGEGVSDPEKEKSAGIASIDPVQSRYQQVGKVSTRSKVSRSLRDSLLSDKISLVKDVKAGIKDTIEDVANDPTGLMAWSKALIRAAAATGINIAEREAYYMASAAGKKYDILGGVRKGGNILRGTI